MASSTKSKSEKESDGDKQVADDHTSSDYNLRGKANVKETNSTITENTHKARQTSQTPSKNVKNHHTRMAGTREDKKARKDVLKTATDAKGTKPKITLKLKLLRVTDKVAEELAPQEAAPNTPALPESPPRDNLEAESGIFSNVNAKIAPKLQIPVTNIRDSNNPLGISDRRSRWLDKKIMEGLQGIDCSETARAKKGPMYGSWADDADSIGTLSPGGYNLPDEPSPVRDREADLAENMGAVPRELLRMYPFDNLPAPQIDSPFAPRDYPPHITNPFANRQPNFGNHPIEQPDAGQDQFTIGNGREVFSFQDSGAANNAGGGHQLTRSVSQPGMPNGRGASQKRAIDQVDGPVSDEQYVMSPQSSFGKTTFFPMKRPRTGLGSRSVSMPIFGPSATPSNQGPVSSFEGAREYRYPSYHKAIHGDKIDPQLILEDDIRFGRAPKSITKIWYTPSPFRRVPKKLAPGELDRKDDTSPMFFFSSDNPTPIRVKCWMDEEMDNGGDGLDNGEETVQHDSDATVEEDSGAAPNSPRFL